MTEHPWTEHPEAAAPASPPPAGGRLLLGRDAILKADDRPTEDVEVPEWGGTVRVRGLSGAERDEYFAGQAVYDRNGQVVGRELGNTSAKLVAMCVIGEDDQRLFTAGDIGQLGAKSAAAIGRVFEVAARLSGLSEEDIASLEKGSGPTPSDATTSN